MKLIIALVIGSCLWAAQANAMGSIAKPPTISTMANLQRQWIDPVEAVMSKPCVNWSADLCASAKAQFQQNVATVQADTEGTTQFMNDALLVTTRAAYLCSQLGCKVPAP